VIRKKAVLQLADLVADIQLLHPVRVGIDGVDAAGKTMLADELVEPLRVRGYNVIRASIDGFHNPREIRYRQGRNSPQGYYDDSFNHHAIVSNVLEPLGPRGNLKYRAASFDFKSDAELRTPFQSIDNEAMLLFEGIFLHRPELRQHWDFSIFVHADFDVTIQRAQKRDLHLFKTAEIIREIYEQRYIPGEQIYLDAETPDQRANVIWHNNDIENPELTFNKPAD